LSYHRNNPGKTVYAIALGVPEAGSEILLETFARENVVYVFAQMKVKTVFHTLDETDAYLKEHAPTVVQKTPACSV
jgi:hypothetical protein